MNKGEYSEPIINKIQDVDLLWQDYISSTSRLYDLLKLTNGNLVKAVKARLGKQDYCFTGFRRYWVWEFNKYRIFVANGKGIGLEVFPKIPKMQVYNTWINLIHRLCNEKETEYVLFGPIDYKKQLKELEKFAVACPSV